MKKIIAIGLSLLIVFDVNAQSARSKVFTNLNTIIKNAEGSEQGKDIFGKNAIILKKQVFSETTFTLTTKNDGADGSWINRYRKIDWNMFYDHDIVSGYPTKNLCQIEVDFNNHQFTDEFYKSDKNGDDNPSETSSFTFYCLLKDKEKVEKELQALFKLVPVKSEPAINAQIRKYTKDETIAWLKEKLSKNIVGDNLTTKIKLISIDECKIFYSYSSIVNRKYEETIPTSILSISKTKRFEYDQKICKIKYFAFGVIDPEDEIIEYNLSFLRLNTTDDDLVSSIACAMKHLAGFCKAPASAQQYPEMIDVPGGSFNMGGTVDNDEKPIHKVTLSSFNMAKTETTVAQWRVFCNATARSMPNAPSWGWIDNYPIVNVSWNDAVDYCNWLSKKTGKSYRLPTEAEWEYAARGGNKSKGYFYAGSDFSHFASWNKDNAASQAHACGLKLSNELDLFDMSGNVWEWCNDWYGDYDETAQTNPKSTSSGINRVLRGGSWFSQSSSCRVAFRSYNLPSDGYSNYGFRVVYTNDKATTQTSVIGKPLKIGNLEVAQYNFADIMNWDDAKKACATLGEGWRLPTIDELNILYENENKIGGFPLDYCWSSTVYDAKSSWTKDFEDGFADLANKEEALFVRAVRSITSVRNPKEKNLQMVLKLVMPINGLGSNGASVVWHQKLKLYYAAMAGNETFPLVLFNALGKKLSEFETGFDVRGLWYNTALENIWGNAYDGKGIYAYELNAKGGISKAVSVGKAFEPPTSQSAAAYDPVDEDILFYDEGEVNLFYEKTSKTIGSTHLSIAANAVYNTTNLIYTGIKQAELGLLNTGSKQVELYDKERGELKEVWHLPKNTLVKEKLNFSYANGIVWLFDTDTRSWIGYR